MLKGNGGKHAWRWTASTRERCFNFHRGQLPQMSRLHTVLFGPEPSTDHSPIELTVAFWDVLSRVRRLFAQRRKVQHDVDDFCGCSGKACERAAWAHSLLLAAARGRDQAAESLLLDLDTIGHDNLLHEGHALRFRLRPLTRWCPSHEGWRFGEAHAAGCRPFRTNYTGAVALHPRPNSCWQLSLRKWATGSPVTGRGMQLNTFQGTQLGFA